jgi:hypothetical protein
MALTIQPYTEDMAPAVQSFNQALSAGDVVPKFRFPESSVPAWLPPLPDRTIYQRYYLALEGESVRGGFILKYQDFSFSGDIRRVAYYHLPLSQGIVNKAYAGVGVAMLRSAMKMEPLLFALGMGGLDRPLPRMLAAMRWTLTEVPFFFHVVKAAPFLREMSLFRSSRLLHWGALAAASTGAGGLTIHGLQRLRRRNPSPAAQAEPVPAFESWADDLWGECSARYVWIGIRDRNTLNILYPAGRNFLILRVSRDSQVIGWAVMLNTQMQDNQYFGNLRVGSIVDCLAVPDNATAVVQLAVEFLAQKGVDLIVANHSHHTWGQAFVHSGFLPGPSNFIFAPSPPLAQALGAAPNSVAGVYLMRGDGDGPVNL